MDFFNQITAQLRDLFGSMTPGARVTAGLLLAVVVVSLGFLFQQTTAGPDEYLFGAEPQSSSKIARMEAAMAAAGITGYAVEGNRIRVPRGQRELAIAAIAAQDELPPDVHRYMDEALDKGSVFDSGEVKRQRMRAAREKQLSHIVGLMPWVDQAVVICDEQETSGLRRARQASVAVSVLPAAGESLTPKRVRVLSSFAAKSCGVPVGSVSVTNLGGEGAVGGEGVDPEDFDHPLYATKAKVERDLRQKVFSQVSFIPGVRVEVKAVLDDKQAIRRVETKPDQASVALETRSFVDNSSETEPSVGSRPGLEAQGPGRPGADEGQSTPGSSKSAVEDSTERFVVGSATEETTFYGAGLKEAYASVGVPRSYVAKVYRQRNRIEPDEEVEPGTLRNFEQELQSEIQNIVEPLLPELSLGENEFKQASVNFFDDLPKAAPPAPSMASDALAWTSRYANTLAMSGLAIFALLMLRSIASGGGDAPAGAARLSLDGSAAEGGGGAAGRSGGGGGGEDGDDDPSRPKLKLRKADTVKDDLAEMVAGDPDAAAAILRSWINNAS